MDHNKLQGEDNQSHYQPPITPTSVAIYPNFQSQQQLFSAAPRDYPNLQSQQHLQTLTVAPRERWNWCTVVLSGFSFFCCTFFGLIAVIASVISYADHKVQDYAGAKRKRNLALGFAIPAIVIGSITVIFVIALMVFYVDIYNM